MLILLMLMAILTGYLLVGSGVYRAIYHIREHDRLRAGYAGRKRVFDTNSDSQKDAFLGGMLWLAIGAPVLIYHLSVIDWDRKERKLIKSLKEEMHGGKTATHDALQQSIDRKREERAERLSAQIEELRGKAIQ